MKYLKEICGHIGSSFRLMIRNPLFIMSSFFVDLLFFLLFGIIYSFFSSGMIDHLLDVNSIIGQLNSQLSAITAGTEDNAVLSAIMEQQALMMEHVKWIAIYAAAILVSTYILWCIFQGINWHLASWVTHGRKTHFLGYLGKFSLIDAVWTVLLVLMAYLTYRVSIYNAMAKITVVSQDFINYLMLFLVAVLLYFAVVSYSLSARETLWGSLKGSVIFGVKKAKFYLVAYVLAALLMGIVYSAVYMLKLGLVASVLIDIVLMFPVFAYGRLLFLEISGKHGAK